jgi:oligogalacturonide lyase
VKQRFAPEGEFVLDDEMGRKVRQVTNTAAIHQHPYIFDTAFDDGMRRLIYVSHRRGAAKIYAEERESGEIIQFTKIDKLVDWSFYPSHDGRYVYFTTDSSGWRVDTITGDLEHLVDFHEVVGQGAKPSGTTALSRCDRWWAISVRTGDESALVLGDMQRNEWNVVFRRDSIEGLQFCPDDSTVLFYAGPVTDRVWAINRDGTHNRRLYSRQPDEWITHEFWISGTREVAFIDWPHGIRCIHVDSGAERPIASFNAWHASSNRAGTLGVADTNVPDIGLQLFDPQDGVGAPIPLCRPGASNAGVHWEGPFPYEKGLISRYNPQHTHPHPSFSPDGRSVVFTSDRTGFAQVYEVEIPEQFIQESTA